MFDWSFRLTIFPALWICSFDWNSPLAVCGGGSRAQARCGSTLTTGGTGGGVAVGPSVRLSVVSVPLGTLFDLAPLTS